MLWPALTCAFLPLAANPAQSWQPRVLAPIAAQMTVTNGRNSAKSDCRTDLPRSRDATLADQWVGEVGPSFFEQVYRLVKQIPYGKVASYGQIAALLGHPRAARTVGWALNALTTAQAAEVPWHRVINSAGRISISRADLDAALQRHLLEEEGVEFDGRGYVDMRRYGWSGLGWMEVEEVTKRKA